MTMKSAALVYPHQLWANHPAVDAASVVVVVEDPLFFTHYKFHSQKLVLHRASMTEFIQRAEGLGKQVVVGRAAVLDDCLLGDQQSE